MENETSFYVTNRPYEQLATYLDLTTDNLEKIPENGKVLEVGSGATRRFAEGLSLVRPDLKIISLDPTLGIKNDDFVNVVRRDSSGKIESVYYTNEIIKKVRDPYMSGKMEDSKKIHKERVQGEDLAVAALAPNLPFKKESFDLIVDTFGPGLYLHEKSPKQFEDYLLTIFDVLKPGGEARIFPVIKTTIRTLNLSLLREASQNYYTETIDRLGLNCVLTFKEIPGTSNEGTNEILMIMRKIS